MCSFVLMLDPNFAAMTDEEREETFMQKSEARHNVLVEKLKGKLDVFIERNARSLPRLLCSLHKILIDSATSLRKMLHAKRTHQALRHCSMFLAMCTRKNVCSIRVVRSPLQRSVTQNASLELAVSSTVSLHDFTCSKKLSVSPWLSVECKWQRWLTLALLRKRSTETKHRNNSLRLSSKIQKLSTKKRANTLRFH